MERNNTPISAGGSTYQHDDPQDFDDFGDLTAAQLRRLEQEHALDFSTHPNYLSGHTAAVGTVADVVQGDYCDLGVYRGDPSDFGPHMEMETRSLDVRVDDPDALEKVEKAADAALADAGWRRTGDWTVADNALYASVERS